MLNTICYICPCISSIEIQINDNEIKILKKCRLGHSQITLNLNSNKHCYSCLKLLNDQEIGYSNKNSLYVCSSCENPINYFEFYDKLNQEEINDKNSEIKEYSNILDKLLKNKNHIWNEILFRKILDIYSLILNDQKLLTSKNKKDKELTKNLEIIRILEKWDNLSHIKEGELIIKINPKCSDFVFEEFYNKIFLQYYNDIDLFKLLSLHYEYEQLNLKVNNEFNNFIKEETKQYKEYNDKFINFSLFEHYKDNFSLFKYCLLNNYNYLKNQLNLIISDILMINTSYPSIYILKRKFSKIILYLLYSKHYQNLKKAQPNISNLLLLYNKIKKIKKKLNENNTVYGIEKIQQIKGRLSSIQEKLKKKIRLNLQSYNKNLKNDFNIIDENWEEFKEDEIKIINKINIKLELSTQNDNINYNINNIELEFIINFLFYLKDKGNQIVHILFDKFSIYYLLDDSEIKYKQPKNINDVIELLFNEEKIRHSLNGNEIINLFKNTPFLNSKIKFITDFIISFIENKENEKYFNFENIVLDNLKDYNEKLLKLKKNMEELKQNIDYLKNILNIKPKYKQFIKNISLNNNNNKVFKIGNKIQRNNKSYYFFLDDDDEFNLIKEVYLSLCSLEDLYKKEYQIYNAISIEYKDIEILNLNVKKIEIIINEIQNKNISEFSLPIIFEEWKEKELNKLKKANIKDEIINKLNIFNFEKMIDILKINLNNVKNFNFYMEEIDLNTFLFLLQNDIPPVLCSLETL